MATFTVTETADSGPGSLRDAIEQANLLGGPTQHKIDFQLPSSLIINPSSPLPAAVVPVSIDAQTQPGFVDKPIVDLNGAYLGAAGLNGLELRGGSSEVRGLVIRGWQSGAGIYVAGDNNFVLGNWLGLDTNGITPRPNQGGIHVENSANTRIGGTAATARNVISGNLNYGIAANDADALLIWNNYVGIRPTGAIALPNGASGINFFNVTNGDIGGPSSAYRNVVSGNGLYGIIIAGPGCYGNLVRANYVGTDATGLAAVPNLRTGVLVYNSPNNIIGGLTAGERNVISGNARNGVNIDGSGPDSYSFMGHANNNTIIGNFIGVDKTGNVALGNGLSGVLLFCSQLNNVGGVETGAENVISGGDQDGVLMIGESDHSNHNRVAKWNWVEGNRIGVGKNGGALPNMRHGVYIVHGLLNHVGSSTPASGNIIRFNDNWGFYSSGTDYLTNTASAHNTITNNVQGQKKFGP